jgi:hypothetical protein
VIILRKLINIITNLLIINFCIFLAIFIYNLTLPISVDEHYIEAYNNNEDNYNLITRILQDTEKKDWIKYVDYIELEAYKNIANDKGNSTAFILSLPKKTSLIALYEKQGEDKYIYKSKITDLYPIKNIYFYKDFLVVEQLNEEEITNPIQNQFIEVFSNTTGSFTSVFKKSIFLDKTYKKISLNDNDDNEEPTWVRYTENSSIDYLDETTPKIMAITSYVTYEGKSKNIPKDDELKEIKNNMQKELYIWKNNTKIFELLEKIEIKN